MLPPLGASRRRPCCRRPLRTWWLPWGHGLSPRGLGPCGSREWWPCLGPWGLGKSSACRLPSWGTSDCWPMGWALSAWWWFLVGTISANSFSISSLYSMGTFRLPCWTGGTVGSTLMSYSPCMSPMQSKLLGYSAWRSLVLSMVTDPGST